jgi:hypothetical protein
VGRLEEQKLASLVGLALSLAILIITITEQIQLHRSLGEAAALGAIIDVSPDQFQMNFRIALALGLGSICLWSRRANSVAVFIGVLFWGIGLLLFFERNVFDRPEPVVHVAGLSCLVFAIICIRRQWAGVLNAILSGFFVLINYVLWYSWTQRVRQVSESGRIYPDTTLNNLLADAHAWHIVVLGITICLLGWEVRLLTRRMRVAKSG